jgi:hypothetical protein
MTSTTSSMTEGIFEQGHRPLHVALQNGLPTQQGWGGFHAPTPSLRQVTWLDKFKPGLINKYDDFSNPEEFIQIYHMVIEATGGDDRVKVNYMLTTLSDVARS